MALGIAVDDTIHYLARFNRDAAQPSYRRAGLPQPEPCAIRSHRCADESGRAVPGARAGIRLANTRTQRARSLKSHAPELSGRTAPVRSSDHYLSR
jgi:hypothetical protein